MSIRYECHVKIGFLFSIKLCIMNSSHQWLEVAQELQSIAQAGLTYSQNKYDLERYEQIKTLSKKIVDEFSGLSMEKINKIFELEEGYLTPKVDVRGVVFRGEKILMVKETIDGKWALPGGWADVGYTASEVVEKEVQEEAGLNVKADKLLAVLDKKCYPHPPDLYYVYKIFFLCKEIGGQLQNGTETSDVSFFGMDELPELSAGRNTKDQVEMMFKLKNNPEDALFS
jgi:ADP-ribose pyrophosphatase YjhB (NUDIX family)